MDPLSQNASSSSSSSSSSSTTHPIASASGTRTHISFADQQQTSDLIDYGQQTTNNNPKGKSKQQSVEEAEMDYGSTDNSNSNSDSRTPKPGPINLPSSPYNNPASISENALSEADGSIHSPSLRPRSESNRAPILSPNLTGLQHPSSANRQRGFSFKRSSRPGSAGTGAARNPSATPNFLKRASIAIGGGIGNRDRDDRKSFSSTKSGDNGGGRWKHFKRFRTTSAVGGPSGSIRINDDQDPFTEEEVVEIKPHVPSLIPQAKSSSTPIPTLPFLVLCLMVFGEFSSAGVAGPFLFFMIEDFKIGGEADVGFWAGIVSAVFFFAQFLTSLLWASVAERHGRKKVLLVSLVGNAATLALFGTSTSLKMAITVRMAQGLFNGAVGVAKGAVRDLTDETNEGRAYAIFGFCWGMGGIIGPLAGGIFEHPATKFPSLFGKNQLLIEYPYLLPCIIGASFTATGGFLSLFLGEDGGARTGNIQLPEKIDVERATHRAATNVGSFGRSAGKRISGYFSGVDANDRLSESGVSLEQTNTGGLPRTFTQQVDYETGGPPSPAESDDEDNETIVTRTENDAMNSGFDRRSMMSGSKYSRTSARHRNILGGGSAYGYEDVRSPALENQSVNNNYHQSSGVSRFNSRANSNSGNPNGERPNVNRYSYFSNNQYAPDFEEIGQQNRQPLSFAQRFLLANDDAVLSLTDLWVAAAINGEEGGYDVIDEDEIIDDEDEDEFQDNDLGESSRGSISVEEDDEDEDDELENISERDKLTESSSLLKQPKHLAPLNFAKRKLSRGGGSISDAGSSGYSNRPRFGRRFSGGNRIPSLYNNTGVERPLSPGPMSPNASGLPPSQQQQQNSGGGGGYDPTLAGIPESHSARNSLYGTTKTLPSKNQVGGLQNDVIPESSNSQITTPSNVKPPSIFSLLPLVIIAQYGLMSLHSSTFEQVFMAFLVTPFNSGGLGLSSQHYAELIAAMAVCQLVFQFWYYPTIGPPLGRFSHLAMMRIGLAMYLPAYALFPYLRNFLHPETDLTVMTGMILFASFRWLANVTAFTAVSVLMNAMTPPHLVPLANGLAQTTSSAARFIGPIIGGIVWMRSVEGGPNAHTWPFNYHEGFLMVGMLGFIGFLHSWTIR